MWIDVANTFILSKNDVGTKSSIRLLLSIAAYTIVCWDIPSSQSTLIQSLVHYISGSSNRKHSQSHMNSRSTYCLIVSSIVMTIKESITHSKLNCFKAVCPNEIYSNINLVPITNLLTTSNNILPLHVLIELVTALSQIHEGKQAILRMIKQNLQSPYERTPFLFEHHDGQCFSREEDRIYIALEGIFVLLRCKLNKTDIDKGLLLESEEIQALEILTEIIASNKPLSPLQVRSELLQKIIDMIEEDCFHQFILERLRNVVLHVFLRYFYSSFDTNKIWDDTEETGMSITSADLKFMPESCLNFWDSSTSSPGNVLAQQTEDLPRLVRLVLLLMKDTSCSTVIREDVKIPKKPEHLTGSVNFPDALLDMLIQSKFDRIIPQGGNWDFSRSIALHCIGSILNYLLHYIRDTTIKPSGHNQESLNSCIALQCVLLQKEKLVWQQSFSKPISVMTQSSRKFPSWTATSTFMNVTSQSSKINPNYKKIYRRSFQLCVQS